ncbi:hypothetical protein ABLN67_14055 [Mycobacterium tuberculosis]
MFNRFALSEGLGFRILSPNAFSRFSCAASPSCRAPEINRVGDRQFQQRI